MDIRFVNLTKEALMFFIQSIKEVIIWKPVSAFE